MKQFYRNLKLQKKLMISYLAIISIPMLLIAAFFYGKVYNMIVADTIRSEQVKSARTAPAVEAALDRLLSDVQAVRELSFYQQVLDSQNSNRLTTLAASDQAASFPGRVEEILAAGPAGSFRVYLDLPAAEMEALNQASGGIFIPLEHTQNSYWRGIFSGSGLTALHCPGFYLSNYEKDHLGNMAYITKNQLSFDGRSVLCYTAVYYSSDIYLEILQENLPTAGSVAYIINDRDSIIATTSPALSSTYYLNYETIQDSFMSSNNFLQKEVLEEVIYAGMYNIKQPRWYMVVVIPSGPLIQRSQNLLFQYLALFAVSIVIALLIAVTLSRSITRRLSLLNRQMAKVRSGPPVPLEESDIHDEIGDLIDTYNYMSREMNRLLRQMEKTGEELRIAEFRSLQAQINPHFLYNTMDMINWMAIQNRTSEIADAVLNLSRFYKLTLSKKESISTVAEEIEHASIYLKLQNMRYPGAIQFVTDISDEFLDYEIPKLTLQPIIENAVLHGIMEKEQKSGTIVLTGWQEEDTAVLLLSDDGVGMDTEILDHILYEKNRHQKGNNIAVYNTHHRLQILYGDTFGLTYQSTPGQGTEVFIRIPAKRRSSGFPMASIIQVSDEAVTFGHPRLTAKSSDLPGFNEMLANGTYHLHSIHEVSEKLPPHKSLYILSHYIPEEFPLHNHSYYEMSYCCKGSAVNCVNGKERIQHTGSLYLLHPDAVHSMRRLSEECVLINLAFHPEQFHHFKAQLGLSSRDSDALNGGYLYFALQYYGGLQSLLAAIVQEYAVHDYQDSPEVYDLLLDFFKQLSLIPHSIHGPDKHGCEIAGYIREHAVYESIDSIAATLGESKESIAALIKKGTGQPIDMIIRESRLNLAVSLAQRPELSNQDIASACGFTGWQQLNTAFFERYRITYQEYREQYS